MPSTILFYTVFISQIIILSYYIPKKMLARMKYVYKTYPPAEYPKLYPRDTHYYEGYHRKYEGVNKIIFMLGFVIIAAAEMNGLELKMKVGQMIVFVYAMIQFMPVIVLEISEFKRLKLMRELKVETTRSAALKPRGFLDFISPALLGSAIVMLLAASTFSFWVHDFNFSWFNEAYEGPLILIATNIYFIVMVGWQVYGKKKDPYLTEHDRECQMKIVSTIAGGTSIAMSIFYMSIALGDVIDTSAYESTFASAYFQLIGLFAFSIILQAKNITNMDFSVYKENGSPA